MSPKKTLIIVGLVFAITFILGATGLHSRTLAAPAYTQTPAPGGKPLLPIPVTPQPTLSGSDQAIQSAFQTAVQQQGQQIIGLTIYTPVITHIQYSADGATALTWIALRDPQTGEIIASEPGLSIVHNTNHGPSGDPKSWSVMLQAETGFIDQVRALPAELLNADIRSRFLDTLTSQSIVPNQVFSGYKLPWTAGLAKYVTNTIGHVYSVSGGLTSCPTSCRYAFDFADGTMFPMLAAKGGTIKAYRTSCPNNQQSCTNYLILEDQSTSPTTYQLYYHMAQETIPQRLRTIGAQVLQGEYIGNADNTGFSTGSHLHFHVYLIPTGTNWSWGNSVDITFDDVTTNGGRPRTCAEAHELPAYGSECMPKDLYTSGNTPAHPPSGTLDLPTNRQVIEKQTVWVQGLATDDIGIARIQVMANYDGTWKGIDDITPSSPYGKDVDLCSAGIPDGPFAMTVRIYDREGSLAPGMPVIQLIKNYACGSAVPPPVTPPCTPSANQVALYTQPDYLGACKAFTLSTSGYTASQLGAVGDNQAASIQVGSGVRAILYDQSPDVTAANPAGRIETFESNDADLADNRIGAHTVSGLWVVSRSDSPDQVLFNTPVGNALAIGAATSADSLVLAWNDGAGATAFDVSLSGPVNLSQNNINATSLSVGSLPAGNYTLSVTGKNLDPTTATWHTNTNSRAFTVANAALPAAASLSIPYASDFETGTGGWTGTGLWHWGTFPTSPTTSAQAWIFNNGKDYNDPAWRAGDLTSPPIQLPASGAAYLSFNYFMGAEDSNTYWDQRRVQVAEVDTSGATGPFKDLRQLADDQQVDQVWLNSSPISLAGYTGKTIRVRFHFDTVDAYYNAGLGWTINNVQINTTAPDTSCASGNTSPATAVSVSIGSTVSGKICPAGDVDYYKLTGKKGQSLLIDINARTLSPASVLDSVVYLLDSDGRSVLAWNDDQQDGVLQDSLLPYILQRDGTYYIKVKPWDYPGAGGQTYFYNLVLSSNVAMPPQSMSIRFPTTNKVPPVPFTITAAATDVDGGPVAQVDFFWHGPDWSLPWVKLGSDINPSNGASFPVNPAQYGDINGSAVYVQARSRTGGIKGQVIWDLTPDMDMPFTQMNSLPAQTNSTLVQLTWTAVDLSNNLDHFDIQFQENKNDGSPWSAWTTLQAPGNQTTPYWFVGHPGSSYNFRMRGVDTAGNIESFPDLPQASTTLAVTCTPDANETKGTSQTTAIPLITGQSSPTFNLCKSTASGAGDTDWVTFNAKANEPTMLAVLSRGGGAAFIANIYQGGNKIATFQSAGYGFSIVKTWIPPATGAYTMQIQPLTVDMFGTDMSYTVWTGPAHINYMPVIGH